MKNAVYDGKYHTLRYILIVVLFEKAACRNCGLTYNYLLLRLMLRKKLC